MGLVDTILLEDEVTLPQFPVDLNTQALDWQTKDIGHPSGDTYKLTNDGRLLRRAVKHREKTEAEKQAEAESHGFDSWTEYVSAVDEASRQEALEHEYPLIIRTRVEAEEWWADHNQHGTFEFHANSPEGSEYTVYWSYEARFTRGDLDEIVFLGDRHGSSPEDLDLPNERTSRESQSGH